MVWPYHNDDSNHYTTMTPAATTLTRMDKNKDMSNNNDNNKIP